MANPNPQNKFQKGNKLGRKPGQPNLMTKDIRTLLREGPPHFRRASSIDSSRSGGRLKGTTQRSR